MTTISGNVGGELEMFAVVVIAILAVPLVLCWIILRVRLRKDDVREDFDGKDDYAPLNPVPLREYTVTGEMDFANPPPGYTSADLPND